MEALLKQLKNQRNKRTIVVCRHGETALNKDDRIRGWSDVPLNPHGVEQAKAMGRKLKDVGIDLIVASDLTRTLQTASQISFESGIPIMETDIALRPWNVGDYTSKPAKEVHGILMKLATQKPEEPIKGGESFDSFRFRVLVGVVSFLNKYPGKLIAFVTHHRNDRLLRSWYEADCPDDFDLDFEHFGQHGIEPGTYDVLDLESDLFV